MTNPDYGTYQQIEDVDETEIWEQQKQPLPDTSDPQPAEEED
jgi:hypothetical protein